LDQFLGYLKPNFRDSDAALDVETMYARFLMKKASGLHQRRTPAANTYRDETPRAGAVFFPSIVSTLASAMWEGVLATIATKAYAGTVHKTSTAALSSPMAASITMCSSRSTWRQ
jgi:hypothetical protein